MNANNTHEVLHIGKGVCEWTPRNSKFMQTSGRFLQRCDMLLTIASFVGFLVFCSVLLIRPTLLTPGRPHIGTNVVS